MRRLVTILVLVAVKGQSRLRDLRRRLSIDETSSREEAKEEIIEILEQLPDRHQINDGDTDETEVRT